MKRCGSPRKRFGIEVTPAQHAAILDAYLHLSAYPEISCHPRGAGPHPCLVLSNGAPRMLEAALTSSGLAGKFRIHLKCRPGRQVYKPDPRSMHWCPRRLHCRRGVSFSCHRTPSMLWGKSVWFSVAWVNRTHGQADALRIALTSCCRVWMSCLGVSGQ
jgi:hypothetical protein